MSAPTTPETPTGASAPSHRSFPLVIWCATPGCRTSTTLHDTGEVAAAAKPWSGPAFDDAPRDACPACRAGCVPRREPDADLADTLTYLGELDPDEALGWIERWRRMLDDAQAAVRAPVTAATR